MEKQRKMRKTLVGVVTSNKMDKTCVVLVADRKIHPLYKKYITFNCKYKVHDEKGECQVGDTVEIVETKPISKDKYFKLFKIIEKAK